MFVDRSEDSHIMISEIAKYAGCRTTKILRLSDDIDILEAKRYLRSSRSRKSISHRVPGAVIETLRNILATQFDLSGGEIENIARKHIVKAILSGVDEYNIADIIDTCRKERINNSTRWTISF